MSAEDELLERCAANCGGAYAVMVQAMGGPVRRLEHVSLADLGLAVALPPNNATLLRAPGDGFDETLEAIHAFFALNPGGGYEIWSLWPSPDLRERGYRLGSAPAMVLPPDSEPRPAPPDLRVVEVADADGARDAANLWIEGFGIDGADPASVLDERGLRAWRVWVGYANGVPVSTAAAWTGEGFVGIYAVATSRTARGRGYGEALTWAAVGADPSMPATLQASSMGEPVYRRMGFETVGTFTIWSRER